MCFQSPSSRLLYRHTAGSCRCNSVETSIFGWYTARFSSRLLPLLVFLTLSEQVLWRHL
jgi:hypothetical protein